MIVSVLATRTRDGDETLVTFYRLIFIVLHAYMCVRVCARKAQGAMRHVTVTMRARATRATRRAATCWPTGARLAV